MIDIDEGFVKASRSLFIIFYKHPQLEDKRADNSDCLISMLVIALVVAEKIEYRNVVLEMFRLQSLDYGGSHDCFPTPGRPFEPEKIVMKFTVKPSGKVRFAVQPLASTFSTQAERYAIVIVVVFRLVCWGWRTKPSPNLRVECAYNLVSRFLDSNLFDLLQKPLRQLPRLLLQPVLQALPSFAVLQIIKVFR